MKKIIKNGTIVTATDTYEADILVEDGVISHIGVDLSAADAELIDAKGHYVFPGGIDPHTHLDMPFGGRSRRMISRQVRGQPLSAVRPPSSISV